MIDIEIYLADNAGFCGGVKRAVDLAFKNAKKGVYSLGDLVHNPQVIDDLNKKGVINIDSIDGVNNSKVIIRSHGVHKSILDKLRENNNEVIDCVSFNNY